MIINYFKIAWRKFIKEPGYSALNVLGLSIGLATSFVLFLFVWQETSYDKHFTNSDQTYRVASDFFNMGGFACTSPALYEWIKENCKEAREVTALQSAPRELKFEYSGSETLESGGLQVDTSFFRVFDFEFKEKNNRITSLEPNQIVLSSALAQKIFGSENVLNETVLIGEERKPFQVAGVLRNNQKRSHVNASFYLPFNVETDDTWTSASVYVYAVLHENSEVTQFSKSLENLRKDVIYPPSANDMTYDEWKSSNRSVDYFIQPLEEIYLHSKFQFDFSARGSYQQVVVLAIIGVFLLVLALINYINLTTARSATFIREVAIKKTLGAARGTLSIQFICETILLGLISMVVAISMAEMLFSLFASITGHTIITSLFNHRILLTVFIFLSLLISLLAGIYPALYISRYNPLEIVRGWRNTKSNVRLRNGLVVFQFIIASALIICSLVLFEQMRFIQETDKGFNSDGVLIVNNIDLLGTEARAFQHEIERLPGIISSSFNDRMPAGNYLWMSTYKTAQMEDPITIETFPVDENYIPTLDIRVVAGRNFSKSMLTDSSAVIVNLAALAALGIDQENAITAKVNDQQKIIGIVEDFNFESLRNAIKPVVMKYGAEGHRLAIKLRGNDLENTIEKLGNLWSFFTIEEEMQFSFLDENFDKLIVHEKMMSRAMSIFTLLAILIACLGLFGLAAFTLEQRRKEIGIRRILGASLTRVVQMLTIDFIQLVFLALVVSIPISLYYTNRWLDNFAYRISTQWWIFILAAILLLMVTFLVVGIHSARAAIADPINSIREE